MAYSTHRNAHWGAGFGFGGLGFGFRQMNPAPVLAPPILRQELAQPEFSKSQSRTAPPPHPTTMDDWHWYTQTEMMKCPSAPRPPSIPYFDSQDDLPDLSFSSSCSSVDMYHNSASPAYYGGLVSPSASDSGLGIGLGLGISSDPNQDAYGYDYDCEYGYGYGLVGLSYNDHSKYSSSSSKTPSSPSSDSEYESQGISEAFLKEIEFTYLNESTNDAHMSALSTLPSSSTIRDLRDVRGQVRTPVNDISRDAVYCSDAASGDHHITNTAFSPSTPSQSNLVSATSSPTRFRVPASARIPIPVPMPRRHSSPTPPQMRTHPRLRAVSTSAATHSLSFASVQDEESPDVGGDAFLSKSLPTSESTATIRAGTETSTSRKSVEGNGTKKDQQQKKPNLSKSRPSSLSRANTITSFRRVSSSTLGRGREEKRESEARPMRRVQSLSGPRHSSSRPQTLTQTEKPKEPRPTRARTIPSLSLPKRPASVAGFAVPPVMGSSSSTQVSRTGSLRKEIPRRMSIGVDSRMKSQTSAGIRDRTSTLGGAATKETLGASESGKKSQPRTGTLASTVSGPASTRLSLSVTETGNPLSVPSFSVYVSEPESEKKSGGEATTTRMTMRKRTASSSSGLSENVVAFPFSDTVEASIVTKPGRSATNYSSVLADKTVRTGSSSLSPSSCSGSGSGSSSSRTTSTSSSKSRSSSRASSPNTTIMARSESSQPRLRAKTNGIATRNGNGKVGNGNRNQNWSASLGSRGRLTSWGV